MVDTHTLELQNNRIIYKITRIQIMICNYEHNPRVIEYSENYIQRISIRDKNYPK